MRIELLESISAIDSRSWNGLLTSGNPFLMHEFLLALESSGDVSPDTGWQPSHLVCLNSSEELIGALPLYVKENSYGEFVFDFAWASAYQQAGLGYYPKLVSAVPFTPATGERFLIRANEPEYSQIRDSLLTAALKLVEELGASSLHVLFPRHEDIPALESADLLIRKDCQFHWHNRGYRDFEQFLAGFTAAKRKKTRRERRRIREQGVRFEIRTGNELTADDWQQIMPLYRTTFLRRGREPYLSLESFMAISAAMPDKLVVFMGFDDTELVAVSICFRSDEVLYGRYWGANRFIDSLHFEACYYQGIEYCIKEGLQRFEPGTQGEHKVSRGFVPAETWSAHWLSHPQFAAAVDDYLERERIHIDRYMDVIASHTPYRDEVS